MFRTIAAVFLLSLTFGASAPPAFATTIEEFKNKTSAEREDITESAVQKIQALYLSETADTRKTNCIRVLFTPASPTRASKGDDLVSNAAENLRGDPTEYHIEGIIFGVINRECP